MFLRDGFDEVSVKSVAAASDVSEKTVYNYFATKESLVLDREPTLVEAIETRFSPGTTASLLEAMRGVVSTQVEDLLERSVDSKSNLRPVLEFMQMIEASTRLTAAQRELDERLTRLVVDAVANRLGRRPNDPESVAVGHTLMGLWFVAASTIRHTAQEGADVRTAREAVERALDVAVLAMQNVFIGSSTA